MGRDGPTMRLAGAGGLARPGGAPACSDLAIWSRGLTKRYGSRPAVDGIDLAVPVGALSGFVGPNGAGKTTTLRLLLGLIRPDAGKAFVLDQPITDPARYLHRVGALIEGPAFYPGLCGRDNLRVLTRLRRVGGARVEEVLALVGLAGRADDPFGSYSLGMKQRLGIAAALLPRPDLLILDEPANGLDPAGIREVRTLLQRLATQGLTVFVSSHLLAEVEQICDHLVMIRAGRLVFQGHVSELLAAREPEIVLVPEHDGDAQRLYELIGRGGWQARLAGSMVTVRASEEVAAQLNRTAMQAGITLRGLAACRPSLEETFLDVIGGVAGDVTGGQHATGEVPAGLSEIPTVGGLR